MIKTDIFFYLNINMIKYCTIQIYHNQEWLDCAIVELLDNEILGWHVPTRTSYLLEYAISHMDHIDGYALTANLPVNVQSHLCQTWPAFLMDLLPQGYGRKELLQQLHFSENAQEKADWFLLKAGAGNPIGHLRIKEAYEWLHSHFPTQQQKGFSLEEIIQRKEHFIESLASYGLFVAGSSGVQGEWPKLLLTQAKDDLFYLDHTLSDEQAKKHWLVKFSRGNDPQLEKILSQEALYMQLAQYLDLRVYQNLEFHGRTLFIPRFDRQVKNDQVERIAQESLASLNGQAGFGIKISHNQACKLIMLHCTDPKTEILEYLKRDLANVALGNKDNHSRNTAIQRLNNGEIRLTPLFDFAPMWLHPDGIARTTRWEKDDLGGAPNWLSVLEQIVAISALTSDEIIAVYKTQLQLYQRLLFKMQYIGIDVEIQKNSQYRIESICQQLEVICYG